MYTYCGCCLRNESIITCSKCSSQYCLECTFDCNICDKISCDCCVWWCGVKGCCQKICISPNCIVQCDGCRKDLCRNHYNYCCQCKNTYCLECYKNDKSFDLEFCKGGCTRLEYKCKRNSFSIKESDFATHSSESTEDKK